MREFVPPPLSSSVNTTTPLGPINVKKGSESGVPGLALRLIATCCPADPLNVYRSVRRPLVTLTGDSQSPLVSSPFMVWPGEIGVTEQSGPVPDCVIGILRPAVSELPRSEEHTSELQSPCNLVCRPLLEKKKKT